MFNNKMINSMLKPIFQPGCSQSKPHNESTSTSSTSTLSETVSSVVRWACKIIVAIFSPTKQIPSPSTDSAIPQKTTGERRVSTSEPNHEDTKAKTDAYDNLDKTTTPEKKITLPETPLSLTTSGKTTTETTGKSPVKSKRAKCPSAQMKLNKAAVLEKKLGETDGEFQFRYNRQLLRDGSRLGLATRK